MNPRSDLRLPPVPAPGSAIRVDKNVSRDPDLIALTIYHETIHWMQKVAKAGLQNEGALKDFVDENEAYKLEADFASAMRQDYMLAGDSVNASRLAVEAERLTNAATQFGNQAGRRQPCPQRSKTILT